MYMRFRLFIVTCVLLLPTTVFGQGITDSLAPQSTLVVDPPYPAPGEVVTVSVNDYASQSFGAGITWTYDGETIPASVNERSVEVVAGALGSTGIIEATMVPTVGSPEVIRAEINPIYLDIIVEPQTRVPDWYLGRPMTSIGSQVNVTALVNDGSLLDPSQLVYTWQVNRQVLDAGPVRGRNKMSFDTPRGAFTNLSLSVSRVGGEIIASKIIRFESVAPTMSFYEQHSLYGSRLFPVSNSLSIIGNAVTVQAEPYYLDTRIYNNPDVSDWEIDSVRTDNGSSNPYEITLQRAASSGDTMVGFHVRSLQEILQGVEDNIRINF